MEHQDNIFEQFKKAAENQESQDFPGMEKVWSRVDAKLDTQVFKAQSKTNSGWQKFAVAASIVIGSVFAFQLWKDFSKTEPQQNTVVETSKEKINSVITNDSSVIVSTETSIVDKKEAEKILEKQINLNSAQPVAIAESPKADSINPRVMATVLMREKEKADLADSKVYESAVSSETVEMKVKKEEIKRGTDIRKASPLVVIDGKASNKKVEDIKEADDLENIVELKDPLYIINGKEYSEKELFGPNPTSPYYPLNKQEIESISIYQNDEAIEQFGDKGEKGVVVIKTKNGKPAKR